MMRKTQMRFSFILIPYIFQFIGLFASPTNDELIVGGRVGSLTTSSHSTEEGYECGNVFFSKSEAENAVLKGHRKLNGKIKIPEYHGPLYDDTKTSTYFLYQVKKENTNPSKNKYNKGVNFVVFKRHSLEVIDVITRLTNHHYTKCIKKLNLTAEQLASIFESTNGYLCGYEFFDDKTIQESLQLAKKKIGGNTKYPAPYVGRLFPENSGYLIWPILFRKVMHKTGNGDGGPYNLIINQEGDLIDVVVNGFSQNFLRCTRSKKFQTAPKHDPHTKLFVPAPKSGFQCGKVFFSMDALNKAAETAKITDFNRMSTRFPTLHDGHPYSEPCLLWPIFNDGKLYKKARGGPFRVVLTLDYKVLSAAIVHGNNKITACESKMIKGKKDHDTSDYICNGNYVTNQQLIGAAEAGCETINLGSNGHKRLFPARYEGPGFEKEGPYLTYPVYIHGDSEDRKRTKPGRFRVVITFECEVVGALSLYKGGIFRNQFVKCDKLEDNPSIITESSHNANEIIYEY